MTDRYEALSKAEPVFAELRNCMDLAVVAALVARENLTAKAAGGPAAACSAARGCQRRCCAAPKQIASQASRDEQGSQVDDRGGRGADQSLDEDRSGPAKLRRWARSTAPPGPATTPAGGGTEPSG